MISSIRRMFARIHRMFTRPADEYRFPDGKRCKQANLDTVFHPQTDDDELPCIEVGGVLVYAYLDPDSGTVRVSVDLDTAADRLVRPDGTVPLRVEVQDTLVLDDRRRRSPAARRPQPS
jgi:hypothetical protein